MIKRSTIYLVQIILCLVLLNTPLYQNSSNNTGILDISDEKIQLSVKDNPPIKAIDQISQIFPGFLKNFGQFPNADYQYYYSSDIYTIGFGSSRIYCEYYSEDLACFKFEISFLGASTIIPTGTREMGHSTNFFDYNEEFLHVTSYGEIWFTDLYPGIDLRYYMTDQGLKYDFIVHPGANPNQIVIKVDNSTKIEVQEHSVSFYSQDCQEQLIVKDSGLKTYQENSEVFSKYSQRSQSSYGFYIPVYDSTKKLIIDPLILSFSTYWGGSSNEQAHAIALDSEDNIYIVGSTGSSNFPVKNAINSSALNPSLDRIDVFVTKFNKTGTGILYSTYIRGDNDDYAYGIVIDGSDNIYITGTTSSDYYPTGYGSAGYMSTYSNGTDGFVTKLNANGDTILYSTGLGGSGRDEAYAIAVDSNGNSYVTGFTESVDFPTKNAYNYSNSGDRDIFVTKFNTIGDDIVYSTYIGGSSSDYPWGQTIAVDSSGYAYITGRTSSANFPTKNAFQPTIGSPTATDCYVAKINQAGNDLVFSSFLGGTESDVAYGIEVDSEGNIYLVGQTSSSTFPIKNAYQSTYGGSSDGFILKLNATGTGLNFSTFLGGNQTDLISAIELDSDRNCYLTGTSFSSNFPVKWAYQDEGDGLGNGDVIVSKLDATGKKLHYSTYLSGESGEFSWSSYDYGMDITINDYQECYVVGYTATHDFPTFNALNSSNNGGTDAFITKLTYVNPSIGVNIISPVNDSITAQSSVTIEWVPIIGDVDYYEVFLDEVAEGTTTATSWNVTLDSDGYHNITVKLCGVLGNSTMDTIWVQRETVNPVINITSPPDVLETDQSNVTINWIGSDSGVGVDYFEVFVNSISQGTTNSSYKLVFLPTIGENNITVIVYDLAGNRNHDSILIQRINILTKPTIISPIGGAFKEKLIISWTPSTDSLNDTITYEIYYSDNDGSSWILIDYHLTETIYEWDISSLPDGSNYRIRVVSSCSRGFNNEDSSQFSFTIFNDPTTTTTIITKEITSGWSFSVFIIAFLFAIVIRKIRNKNYSSR